MPIRIAKHTRSRPSPDDGLRCLVTRYWPYGLPKHAVDRWLRDLAPSKRLLKALWGACDLGDDAAAERAWAAFLRGYNAELTRQRTLIAELRRLHRQGRTVTLLCTCHNARLCHRALLARVIRRGFHSGGRR